MSYLIRSSDMRCQGSLSIEVSVTFFNSGKKFFKLDSSERGMVPGSSCPSDTGISEDDTATTMITGLKIISNRISVCVRLFFFFS